MNTTTTTMRININVKNQFTSKKTHSKKLKHHQKKKLSESRRVMFIFGALIGLILAALFTTNSESFTRDLDKLVNLDQFSDIFDDWKDLKI